jgi:regulator of cell morphogenesis and NO signaling
MIDTTTCVRDFAVKHPKTLRVFEKHGIDYCCGGGDTLAKAATDNAVDFDALLGDLRDAINQPPAAEGPERDWTGATLAELADYIVEKHHSLMKAEVPRLDLYMQAVVRAHGPRHGDMLLPLERNFQTLKTEVEAHLKSEEQQGFPGIKRLNGSGAGEELAAWIRQTISEHEALGALLADTRKVTSNYALPADACPTFTALYAGLQAVERDLHRHIHLENNILFPRALARQ